MRKIRTASHPQSCFEIIARRLFPRDFCNLRYICLFFPPWESNFILFGGKDWIQCYSLFLSALLSKSAAGVAQWEANRHLLAWWLWQPWERKHLGFSPGSRISILNHYSRIARAKSSFIMQSWESEPLQSKTYYVCGSNSEINLIV